MAKKTWWLFIKQVTEVHKHYVGTYLKTVSMSQLSFPIYFSTDMQSCHAAMFPQHREGAEKGSV